MKHENLVSLNELRSNYHRERFGKLAFRALALPMLVAESMAFLFPR